MTDQNEIVERFYTLAVKEKLYANKSNLRHHLRMVFGGIPLENNRVLDIGGGNGICAFYAGCMGAEEAICLEPEADGVIADSVAGFQRMQACGLSDRVRFEPVTFQRFVMQEARKFDVILLYNSINHLDEWACINLLKEENARRAYRDLFEKIYNLSNHGASLIICDCARRNFYTDFGIRNPLAPMIEWHKHQSPKVWASLAAEVGFSRPKFSWNSFNSLGSLGRHLLGNKFAAYFLASHFRLEMHRD